MYDDEWKTQEKVFCYFYISRKNDKNPTDPDNPFVRFAHLFTQMATKMQTDHTGMIPNLPGMPCSIFGPQYTQTQAHPRNRGL